MNQTPSELSLTLDHHNRALKEISFLLHHMAQTVTELVGRATRTVALSAGREAAKKMPLFGEVTDLEGTIQAAVDKMAGGFDIKVSQEGEDMVLTFDRCIIRTVCQDSGEKLGGDLCTMFHGYFNGILVQFTNKGLRFKISEAGPVCKITHSL